MKKFVKRREALKQQQEKEIIAVAEISEQIIDTDSEKKLKKELSYL